MVPDFNGKQIVIVDLDGTLADGRWRLHLLPSAEERHLDSAWAKFNLAGANDPAFTDTITVVNSLADEHYIIILTGRGAVAEDVTRQWLADNQVIFDELIMRPVGDCRKDTEFKSAIVNQIGQENILCAFDDLPHIVDMFRKMGITTYEVTRYDNQDEYVNANSKYGDK